MLAGMGAELPEQPWVQVVRDLQDIRDRVDDAEFRLINFLHDQGMTWQAIADELGIEAADTVRVKYSVLRSYRR